MSDVLVYATESRGDVVRSLLAEACSATGVGARLEMYGTGSLYQRLGPRRAAPFPDIVMWFGPFAARAAAVDALLQPYQPLRVPDHLEHDPEWKWTTLSYSAVGLIGAPAIRLWTEVASVTRLAIADPERSEVGMSILLASLDRARQVDGDVERGWAWWQQRVFGGLVLAEDDAGASLAVEAGGASHALTLGDGGSPIAGLAPIPHAVGLAAASRNVDAARRMLDWLTSESAGAMLRLSPWQSDSNGLGSLLAGAPPLDVEWGRGQYVQVRRRWAQSGFGPTL